MVIIFNRSKQEELSVQDVLQVKGIYNEMIETKQNHLVKIFSVSPVNKSLMSHDEEEILHQCYEEFLKGLERSVQLARVSQPVNMESYLKNLKKELKGMTQENLYKVHMMKGYIRYVSQMQQDRSMFRRNRYIIIDQPFEENKREEAEMELKNAGQIIKTQLENALNSYNVEVHELTNEELGKCLHMFIDYENAQMQRLSYLSSELPYMIGKRGLLDTVERLKEKKEQMGEDFDV